MCKIYITDFGAGPSNSDNSKCIQSAIDSLKDGGTVIIPVGEFTTGAISLRSNITLYLESGAVLKAHGDIRKYMMNGYYDSFGKETNSLITAYNCENTVIDGDGVIDLIGSSFVDFTRPADKIEMSEEEFSQTPARPLDRPRRPILFSGCENINIRNIKIKDSPCWTLTFHNSENIKIDSISVENCPRIPHNDGLHFTACKNVTVSGCDFVCGDDCIAITSLFDYSLPTDGIIISDCHMSSRSAAIRVGHISSKVNNVTVTNVTIDNTNRGIAVFAGNDGYVKNVAFSNITVNTRLYNGDWWGKGEPIVLCTYNSNGSIDNVSFDNVKATSENSVVIAGENISNVRFKNCFFDIDTEKYAPDAFELSPNGFAPRNGKRSAIVNLSNTELLIK